MSATTIASEVATGKTFVPNTGKNLTALDRCDRCGAQAYARITKTGQPQEILFCNHHKKKHEVELVAKGWDIEDQSERLFEHTKPDGGSAAG